MKRSELRQIIKEIILNETTRSRVGILNSDGTINSIYVHSDGQVYSLGKTLKNYYNNQNIIKSLIKMGDASSIEKNLSGSKNHSFSKPDKDVSIFYGRDRKENNTDPVKSNNIDDFIELTYNDSCEYAYLFDNNKWKYVKVRGNNKEFKEF